MLRRGAAILILAGGMGLALSSLLPWVHMAHAGPHVAIGASVRWSFVGSYTVGALPLSGLAFGPQYVVLILSIVAALLAYATLRARRPVTVITIGAAAVLIGLQAWSAIHSLDGLGPIFDLSTSEPGYWIGTAGAAVVAAGGIATIGHLAELGTRGSPGVPARG